VYVSFSPSAGEKVNHDQDLLPLEAANASNGVLYGRLLEWWPQHLFQKRILVSKGSPNLMRAVNPRGCNSYHQVLKEG